MKLFYTITISAIIFFVDRITKYCAVQMMQMTELTSWLSLQLSFNRGMAWSIFHSSDSILFYGVTGFIVIFATVLAFYTGIRWFNNKNVWGEMLVLIGACSNILDRFLYGGVVDFIVISVRDWSWPSFNVADAIIVLGAFLMMYTGFDE